MLNTRQIQELLLQALETELGGVQVYTTALACAVDERLRKEWEEYLEQTRQHVERLEELCRAFDVDPEEESPGRLVVRHIGESLVVAMDLATDAGDKQAAQLVATECVVLAETKDHASWELLGELAGQLSGRQAQLLQQAHKQVEAEEDEHLDHAQGWSRELWIDSLGMTAVLPPPEDAEAAAGTQRAKATRKQMT